MSNMANLKIEWTGMHFKTGRQLHSTDRPIQGPMQDFA